jgi:uncharacterized protein (TIGR03086 family)
MDIRELDRRAMAVTARIVPEITAAQWDDPTPCGDWRVRDLLAHVIGQYHGFALAATGARTGIADFRPRQIGADPVAEYTEASELVTTAFAADGVAAQHAAGLDGSAVRVLDRAFHLPEIRDGGPFPAPFAIGFHLVDEVVHAWDLAVSVGLPFGADAFDADVLERTLAITRQVPDDPATRGPGFAFASGLDVPEGCSALDEILARLGRDPGWKP